MPSHVGLPNLKAMDLSLFWDDRTEAGVQVIYSVSAKLICFQTLDGGKILPSPPQGSVTWACEKGTRETAFEPGPPHSCPFLPTASFGFLNAGRRPSPLRPQLALPAAQGAEYRPCPESGEGRRGRGATEVPCTPLRLQDRLCHQTVLPTPHHGCRLDTCRFGWPGLNPARLCKWEEELRVPKKALTHPLPSPGPPVGNVPRV